MSTYRRKDDRNPIIKVSLRKEDEESNIDIPIPIYNYTQSVIDKDTSFHWGDIY